MNPYVILGFIGALALSSLGCFFSGEHYQSLTDGRAVAAQKIEAAGLLATETAKSAAKDSAYADLANKLDSEHAKAIEDSDAARADFAERLRIAASGKSSRCPTASSPANPILGKTVTTGSNDGPRNAALANGEQLRDAVKVLQAYAVSCHEWAASVGR